MAEAYKAALSVLPHIGTGNLPKYWSTVKSKYAWLKRGQKGASFCNFWHPIWFAGRNVRLMYLLWWNTVKNILIVVLCMNTQQQLHMTQIKYNIKTTMVSRSNDAWWRKKFTEEMTEENLVGMCQHNLNSFRLVLWRYNRDQRRLGIEGVTN